MSLKKRVDAAFSDLFPINRSLTSRGVYETFDYLLNNFHFDGEIKSIPLVQKSLIGLFLMNGILMMVMF